MMEYALVIFGFVAGLFIYSIKFYGKSWAKTREGKGVLFGLIAAPLAAICILIALTFVLTGCSSFKNPYVDVYAGLERTKNLSPQCEIGGADDKLTSNLGVGVCSEISSDRDTHICGVYRHHSCAITNDDRSYDAFGLTVHRKIYLTDKER